MSATTQISAQQETWTSSSVSKPHGGGACRKGNYTVREKECFLEIMEDYAHIIEARGNSAESRWQKEQAWETISIRYNACIGIENLRDRTQLGILWKNLKARCKHEMATAVDPNTIAPPDPIGLKVSSLVRRGKNGEQSVSSGGSDDLIDSATSVSKQNFISTLIGGATIKTEPNSSDNEGNYKFLMYTILKCYGIRKGYRNESKSLSENFTRFDSILFPNVSGFLFDHTKFES